MTRSADEILAEGRKRLAEFDPRRMVYLTPYGEWAENPESPWESASSEFLYRLYQNRGEELDSALRGLLGNAAFRDAARLLHASQTEASDPNSGSEAGGGRPSQVSSFSVVLTALAWMLLYQARRIGANAAVRSWDREGRGRREAAAQALRALEAIRRAMSARAKDGLQAGLETLESGFPSRVRDIPGLLSEELGLEHILSRLRERAREPENREECHALMIERLRPAMGIADNVTPALLRPCLRLLHPDRLDLDSGLPYNAAVILSILRDGRSAATVLEAMEHIPVAYAKIRENLIFTLGSLEEPRAVPLLLPTLDAPDVLTIPSPGGQPRSQLIREQKEEALRALGRLGIDALQALPSLIPYVEHDNPILRTYLAWAMGELGGIQIDRFGGVSADLVIGLLRLLKSKERKVFEEAVSALRRIRMPDFIHTLYLYSVGAVSILGLKPAQRGLYELSETLHHLIRTRGRAIIAVNGDSGTGKTYFCQAIQEGFGGIGRDEILYLMRDRRRDQKVFNRLLGLKWLRKYIEPDYYLNDPPPEDEADAEDYFQSFLAKHGNKKLIILDGCRDRHYFQRVIDLFYFHGLLDVEVNFRATLATRRINLETREKALDSVKSHLSFLEEPALEDTHFYREGRVILYDLDNSMASRLNREEIRELFSKQKISAWGELIRVGTFAAPSDPIPIHRGSLKPEREQIPVTHEPMPERRIGKLAPLERKFRGVLNHDRARHPHRLETIALDDLKPTRLALYAQDQIAGMGAAGAVYVLSFIDNRIFYTEAPKAVRLVLQGREIFLVTEAGGLMGLSFERGEVLEFPNPAGTIRTAAAFGADGIVTGHEDGTVRIWDIPAERITTLEVHRAAVTAVAAGYDGRIFSSGLDGTLRISNPESGAVRVFESAAPEIRWLRPQLPGRWAAVSTDGRVRILDERRLESLSLEIPGGPAISGMNLLPDGRILLGMNTGRTALIDPTPDDARILFLRSHSRRTDDILPMGPRIITCGTDDDGRHSLRILGTETFIRTEAARRELQEQ